MYRLPATIDGVALNRLNAVRHDVFHARLSLSSDTPPGEKFPIVNALKWADVLTVLGVTKLWSAERIFFEGRVSFGGCRRN